MKFFRITIYFVLQGVVCNGYMQYLGHPPLTFGWWIGMSLLSILFPLLRGTTLEV